MERTQRLAEAIVLLQPPGTCRTFTRSGSCYPPLGLCQLAATVPPEQVTVLDGDGMGWDEDQTIAAVLAKSPGLVGMTVNSYTLELVEHFAHRLCAHGIAVTRRSGRRWSAARRSRHWCRGARGRARR